MDHHTWWDPPLTDKGKLQAKEAGKSLQEMNINFEKIYVSPLLRTVQTAEQIAAVLGKGVEILPGISQCALVIQQAGVEHMLNKYHSLSSFLKHCPSLQVNSYLLIDETFDAALKRVGVPGRHILVVTHREGIYNTYENAQKPAKRVSYCAVVHVTFDRKSSTWNVY